jgi:hypothetical protein
VLNSELPREDCAAPTLLNLGQSKHTRYEYHLKWLFEPFCTARAEGLGIGLSISRSIVEAHGGRLTAGANAPHEAVFCIWLPVQQQMPQLHTTGVA